MNKFLFKPKDLNILAKEISAFDGKIVVIAGSTASGKSEIAQQMAKKFGGIIVNTDSRQVYKELKIGTSSPLPNKIFKSKNFPSDIWEIDGIKYFLYGYKTILKPFSVSGFKQDLTSTISKLEQTCPKIFLVGGSGLFIDAFIYNYNLDPESKVSQLARRELAKLPVIELQKILDESSFKKLSESDQKNPYRLMRHIERSGQKYSKGKTIKHLYTVIDVPIQELEERIKLRTEKMFVNGLVEENDQIRELEKNNDQLTIIHKTIGYKEFDPFYLGEKSIEEVKAEINLRTRQYAKRQITWFKKKL